MNKDEAKNLLPWYAVGALEDDEAQAVEVFLNDSPELQQELAQLRVLGDAVAEVGEDEPVFRSELINDALARIETVEQVKPTRTPIVEEPMTAQEGGFIAWLRDTLVGGWQESPGGARLAMVVQFGFFPGVFGKRRIKKNVVRDRPERNVVGENLELFPFKLALRSVVVDLADPHDLPTLVEFVPAI